MDTKGKIANENKIFINYVDAIFDSAKHTKNSQRGNE